MAVSSIGSYGLGPDNMSAGSSIVTASDNPSGLAISESLKSEKNSYDVGADNAALGKEAMKTADSALSGITSNLQRIRELSVQASNTALYSAGDISAMQEEVGALLKDIQKQATETTFNSQSLLDGNFADQNLATNPDGTGMSIKMANSTLESLGIEDYDVTKDFDISTIDNALEKVSESRSSIGAQTNALDTVMNANRNTSENLTAAQGTNEDLDVAQYKSEQQKTSLLESYKAFIQQQEQQRKETTIGMFNNL